MNKKGFTLVELLATIVILGVLSTIGIASTSKYLTQSRKKSYRIMSQTVYEAAMNCITQGKCSAPTQSGSVIISTNTLIRYGYLKKLDNPYSKKSDCSGNVTITNKSSGNSSEYQKYTYDVQLTCEGVANNTLTWPNEKSNQTSLDELKIKPTEKLAFRDDSWSTIASNVKTGNVGVYKVGDTKVVDMGDLGTHTVRVANTSSCTNGETSQTACGFVVEFADVITTHNMNSAATNVGGWPASGMRTYLNGTIYNALPSDLQNAIATTKVISSHGATSGETNFTSSDKLYLLSTKEVWGKDGTSNKIVYDTSEAETRQLDYYKNKGITTVNRSEAIKQYNGSDSYWWLRSASSEYNDDFFTVGVVGVWGYFNANRIHGVSPAFRIS